MESRTNIVLDDELVEQAMAKAGVSTKKAAIDTALRAYVRAPDWKGLLALAGSGVLADDYDPSALFTRDAAPMRVAEPRATYRGEPGALARASRAGQPAKSTATKATKAKPRGTSAGTPHK